MSSWTSDGAGETGGKTYAKRWGGAGGIKKLLQAKVMPYFRNRLRQDDSQAVCMSDRKLGGGIRQTGSSK